MWEDLLNNLARISPAGILVVAIVFAGIVRVLWRTNKKLLESLESLHKEYTEAVEALQEKRISEAKEVTETIIDNTRELDKAVQRIMATMETFIELHRGD